MIEVKTYRLVEEMVTANPLHNGPVLAFRIPESARRPTADALTKSRAPLSEGERALLSIEESLWQRTLLSIEEALVVMGANLRREPWKWVPRGLLIPKPGGCRAVAEVGDWVLRPPPPRSAAFSHKTDLAFRRAYVLEDEADG